MYGQRNLKPLIFQHRTGILHIIRQLSQRSYGCHILIPRCTPSIHSLVPSLHHLLQAEDLAVADSQEVDSQAEASAEAEAEAGKKKHQGNLMLYLFHSCFKSENN